MTTKELYELIEGDYESASRTLMNDTIMSRFIVKLLDDKSFSAFKKAAENMDPKELFESSHAMKGAYANLGLMKLSGMASEITEEYRPGHARTMSDAQVTEKINAIEALYNKTIDGIHRFADEQ